MSYRYKDIIGRQRVIPITNIILYPRGKYLQFHIWVVDPYSYTEDIVILDLLILIRLYDNGQFHINNLLYWIDSLVPLYGERMVYAEVVQIDRKSVV